MSTIFRVPSEWPSAGDVAYSDGGGVWGMLSDLASSGLAGLLVAVLVVVIAVRLVARLARTVAKVAVVVIAIGVLTGGGIGFTSGLLG